MTRQIRLEKGVTPESIMVQGQPSDNAWQKEIWLSTIKDEIVWDKTKTIKNCWEKYSVTSVADSGYRIELPQGSIAPKTPGKNIVLQIPIVDELYWLQPGLLCDTNLWRQINTKDTLSYRYLRSKRGFSYRFNHWNNKLKNSSEEIVLNLPRLAPWRRNIPNNKFNADFFDKIKQYFYYIPIMSEVNNLFGCPNDYSPHWNWSGAVQQLWSLDNKPWKFYFMSPIPRQPEDLGVSAIAMLANTNISNIEFYYDGSVKIGNMESMFASIRTDNWGIFNVTIKKVEKPNWDKEPTAGIPNLAETTERSNDDYYLFEPTNVIKTFRACQISQDSLNNIMDHLSWRNCNSWVGCFHSGLRTQHSYIKPAAGANKFQDTPHNVWWVSKIAHREKNFGERYYNSPDGVRYDLGTQGGLFECFTDSPIEEVGSIIDLTYVYENSDFVGAFGAWRETEGCRFMKRVRLRGLGNLPFYDFNNGNDQKNNGKHFDQDSVEYIFNHGLRDLTKFEDTQEAKNKTLLLRSSSKLYCPIEWEKWITEEMINAAKEKGWQIYINNIEK